MYTQFLIVDWEIFGNKLIQLKIKLSVYLLIAVSYLFEVY